MSDRPPPSGASAAEAYNYVVACNAYSDHGLSAKDIREIGPTKLAALTGNLKVLPGTRKVRELAKSTTVRRFVAAVNGYEAPDVVTLTVEAGSKKTLMQHLKSLGYSSNGRDVRANSRAIRLLIKASKLSERSRMPRRPPRKCSHGLVPALVLADVHLCATNVVLVGIGLASLGYELVRQHLASLQQVDNTADRVQLAVDPEPGGRRPPYRL